LCRRGLPIRNDMKVRGNADREGAIRMDIQQNRNVEIEKTNVEKKVDTSMVASTFIKYAAYIVIFFGAIWFLVKYVLPMFG
jgi:hypothetical protein